MFMVGASSDHCDFAAAMTRRAEVAGVLCNSVEMLSSWEPSQHVRVHHRPFLLSLQIFVRLLMFRCRMRGRCSGKHLVRAALQHPCPSS